MNCLRCNHEWVNRKPAGPKCCPYCRSPYWDKPYAGGHTERLRVPIYGEWLYGEYQLYFAVTTDNKYIKVGISTSPKNRRRLLEYVAHEQLGYLTRPTVEYILIAAVKMAPEMEVSILEKFKQYRIPNTEWFDSNQEILDYIETFRKGKPKWL